MVPTGYLQQIVARGVKSQVAVEPIVTMIQPCVCGGGGVWFEKQSLRFKQNSSMQGYVKIILGRGPLRCSDDCGERVRGGGATLSVWKPGSWNGRSYKSNTIHQVGAEARYVLRSGRWSSQGVSQSGGALRASPSLVELSGRLPAWWRSQGSSQSREALRAPCSPQSHQVRELTLIWLNSLNSLADSGLTPLI